MNIFENNQNFDEIANVPVVAIMDRCNSQADYTFAVPTYMRPETLEMTLDSILRQNKNICFNIIVSDNNSERDDDTEKLIKSKYSCCTSLSYYKNSKNIHPHGNWNRLFMLCRSKYLILVHDDDVLLDNYLSDIDKILKLYPNASAINVNKRMWNGKLNGRDDLENTQKGCKIIKHTAYTDFIYFLFGAQTGCLLNVDDVKNCGGFNGNVGPSFDYHLALLMGLKGNLLLRYDKDLLLYRSVNNTSNQTKTQLEQLEGDDAMCRQLGALLLLPRWYISFSCWVKMKQRLTWMNHFEPINGYKGIKPGGFLFKLVSMALGLLYVKLWVNNMHCVNKI